MSIAFKAKSDDVFRISDREELSSRRIMDFIKKNDAICVSRYNRLWGAYNGEYLIDDKTALPPKDYWKPDNRIKVNFCRNITENFMGFHLGIPIKVSSENDEVQEYVTTVNDMNDSDDQDEELETLACIFGRAYRIPFVNEDGEIEYASVDPRESFMIYSNSIRPKKRAFVRTYVDEWMDADGTLQTMRRGSVSDETMIRYFRIENGELVFEDEFQHGFFGVPCVEVMISNTRRGIFEDVLPLNDAYNKVLSEKADDSESFSDAYLLIKGAECDDATVKFIRNNRLINLKGKNAKDAVVEFLQRPNGDQTQENLLNRLERLIFVVAMICNISDDNFATSSGIALKYKMLPMINLSTKAWRKFQAGLNQFWELVCSNPVTPLAADDWSTLVYTHTLNYPANVSEEADTAKKLDGVTSKKTQLSVLSIVDDVDAEMEQIAKEQEEAEKQAAEETKEQAEALKGAEDAADDSRARLRSEIVVGEKSE